MKKFLLPLFLSFGLPAHAQEEILVCPSCLIKSISQAIEECPPHGIVRIKKGLYNETGLMVRHPMSLIGEPGAIIDAQEGGDILIIVADSVVVRGLEFHNVGVSYVKDWAAIVVDRSHGFVLEENKLINTFFGIFIKYSEKGIIQNNLVQGDAVEEISSGNAIHLWYCKEMKILNNTAIRHRDGIYFEFVDNSIITGNVSQKNVRYGLHFMFSNDDIYKNNLFENNGSGVAVMFSSGIEMMENEFRSNWGPASYGLLLKDITDSFISDNVFEKNTTAIYAEGATRITISENDFKSNGYALKVLGSSMENEISHNNFQSNSFDLFTNSARNYNLYDSNYWSAYKGYDLDRDGIGDVPHRPVNLFTYVVEKSNPAIILMRSMVIGLLDLAEKATPAFTPEGLMDENPLMNPVK